MILFAQPLTDGVIGLSALVLMNHHIDASFEQQGDEEVRTEASVSQKNVTGLETLEEGAEQRGLPSWQNTLIRSLSWVAPDGMRGNNACGMVVVSDQDS